MSYWRSRLFEDSDGLETGGEDEMDAEGGSADNRMEEDEHLDEQDEEGGFWTEDGEDEQWSGMEDEDGTAPEHGDFGQDFFPGYDDINYGIFSEEEDNNPESGTDQEPRRRGRPREARKLFNSVQKILQTIEDEGLTIPQFLSAFSWGDFYCAKDPSMSAKRRAFLQSDTFRTLLFRWWKPPRSPVSRKPRPQGGSKHLTAFAKACVYETANEELKKLDPVTRTTSEKLSEKELTSFDLGKFAKVTQECAPVLSQLLASLATTEQQRKTNTHKNPQQVSIVSIDHKHVGY